MNKAILVSSFWLLLFAVSGIGQEAIKLEEFDDRVNCEDFQNRIDSVNTELTNNPNSSVFVLIYEGKTKSYDSSPDSHTLRLPQFGQANVIIRSMKVGFKPSGIPLEKITFIKAGFRKKVKTEIWHVPADANPPTPSPTIKKMKYRKGKPSRFCDVF